jgi:hypothetical protein
MIRFSDSILRFANLGSHFDSIRGDESDTSAHRRSAGTKLTAVAFSSQLGHILETTEAAMPYARARRFFLTPPSVPVFFISALLALLAVLVTYGYVTAIRPSYAFVVLLIGYVVLAIGCLFRRV